ncbi:MAG: B12-binding domain-containing radical SAM protein [Candidatus Bathyarchaeota archaeon]|nr:B12-binding domain-containing radical SAM protein [Candidatus Bathyarchaeota archaeon]
MFKRENEGCKVVLTADRTLMSEYRGGIFLGFSACVPKGLIPDWLYFSMFSPSVPVNEDGSVKYAPCGTRKVEAALLEYGFKRKDVIVAHPEHLDKVVGSKTKVIGITETDPLGIGPATSTFTQLFDGEAYMNIKFRELLSHSAIRRYRPRIIVGGPGAWQLEDKEIRSSLGIDCVVVGEGEKVVGPLFKRALDGESLPEVVHGNVAATDEIPLIKEATIDGIVEVARGCGRGCEFCVPTLQRYRCLPISDILKEVEVNLRAGRRPLLHAEDVLRYKAKGLEVNGEAVVELFKTVRNYPGVNAVGMSHFALSSIASAPEVVEEISNILGAGEEGGWLSGQTGLETGSPRLIRANMKGKCKPFEPEDWPQVAIDAFDTMSRNCWVPCATLIIGLPNETEKDIDLTVDLLEELKNFKSLIVPLFLVSMGGLKDKSESFTIEKMTPKQSELFLKCWEHNIKWGQTLLQEYFLTKSGFKGYGLRFLISYSINQAKKLIQQCKDDYDCDLAAMIQDERSGKISFGPAPIRFIYRYLRESKQVHHQK